MVRLSPLSCQLLAVVVLFAVGAHGFGFLAPQPVGTFARGAVSPLSGQQGHKPIAAGPVRRSAFGLRMAEEAEEVEAADATNATADANATETNATAAPPPKKVAKKKAAAAAGGASLGFSGVPVDFQRPGPTGFPTEPTEQTFLGMRGPRAPGHRESYGGKHAATMLALAALLWQPISEAGMYQLGPSGSVSKSSFDSLEVPGFGKRKTVPTIEAFFPFTKTGFAASPTLFSQDSMVTVSDPRDSCGAFNPDGGKCHTFLDEMADALNPAKKPADIQRGPVKQSTFFPWTLQKLD